MRAYRNFSADEDYIKSNFYLNISNYLNPKFYYNQSLLAENGIDSKIEDPYHFNVTAGWVDPFCNNNERNIFVLEKDLQLAKKILSDSL